ncbi:hypothetical protein SLA2020_378090 [Shorea laevis]
MENLKMNQQPHILILPFPLQGHIKPFLNLAALLSHAGLHVTFLNTEHNHRCLTHLQKLSTQFPTLHFESIPDGLPADHPRRSILHVADLMPSIDSVMKQLFRELLGDLCRKSELPVTCVISDGLMPFAIDFAKELGIRAMSYRVFTAACLLSFLCLPKLIEEGQVPIIGDDDLDRTITCIPGMEGLLRGRDLPSLYREPLDCPAYELFIKDNQAMAQGLPLILNTCDNLEAPILSHLAPLFSNVYTIGSINALLRSRVGEDIWRSLSSFSNLWEENRSCITWLDSQPLRSVVYVSFGSLTVMTRGQLMELWHGLVNSGKPFLWVIRDDGIESVEGEQGIPVELQKGTKGMGFLAHWTPQEEVLAHPAVGGFLTHGGWNSILESIAARVPMLCWAQLGDQQINSRLVSEVWRIGLDMKDTCDRSTVEKMIKTLMEDRSAEFITSMDRIAKLAHDCVNQCGSSYHNLDKLIEDLKEV